MELALLIFSTLLFLAGVGICLINAGIVLRNFMRATRMSMVPLWGSILMAAGLLLRLPGIAPAVLIPFLLFDLSGLPSLLILPICLLLRTLRGEDAPPLLSGALKAGLVLIYMLWLGLFILVWGLLIFGGGDLLPTPS